MGAIAFGRFFRSDAKKNRRRSRPRFARTTTESKAVNALIIRSSCRSSRDVHIVPVTCREEAKSISVVDSAFEIYSFPNTFSSRHEQSSKTILVARGVLPAAFPPSYAVAMAVTKLVALPPAAIGALSVLLSANPVRLLLATLLVTVRALPYSFHPSSLWLPLTKESSMAIVF